MVGLALIASPRQGNTAAAAQDLLDAWSGPERETKEVFLDRLRLQPIGDCRRCMQAGQCSKHDSFPELMQDVYSAELLVLATPLYWYGPSAQLKIFIDRWSCLLDTEGDAFRARMRGKRTVLLLAQGEQGFYEAALCLQMLDWTLRYLDMVVAARIVVVGHRRTDYARDPLQRHAVRSRGEDLVTGRTVHDHLPPWAHMPHQPGTPLGGVFKHDVRLPEP
ncbi:MAG TPA: NAD(P)H-dependent oxidoreductase [Candidatus Dormibacteraeota bacterium]|nr:NAD(P)H-dependent oxidoreductase [Candidatus Dormibacteraeota bacterium]